MKKIETITIAKQQSYNLTAQGVLLTFIAVAIFQSITGKSNQDSSVWAFILAFVFTIIVHELLHGVGFYISGAKPRFGLGMAGIMPVAYATSSDKLPIKNMLVVAYLPFVVLSIVFIALSFFFPEYQPLFMIGFVGNFAGAIGDVWIASKLIKYLKYKDTYVVDTKTGTEVYSSNNEASIIGQKSQAKTEKPSSFGMVASISFMIILTLQIVIPIILAFSNYDGLFQIGTDAFHLLRVDQSSTNASMELNLLAPLIGGIVAGGIYTLVEQRNRKNL